MEKLFHHNDMDEDKHEGLVIDFSEGETDDDEIDDGMLTKDETQTSTSSVPLDSSTTSHGSTYTSDEETREASRSTKRKRQCSPIQIPKKYGTCSPEELVEKRRVANVLERKRMRTLNEALTKLKKCLPREYYPYQRKLSKIRTLRCAIDYIGTLTSVLNDSPAPVPSRVFPEMIQSFQPGLRNDSIRAPSGMHPPHVPSVPGLFSSVFSPLYPSTPVQHSSFSSDSSPNTSFYPSPPDNVSPFQRHHTFQYQSSPIFPVSYGFPALYQATEDTLREDECMQRHKRFKSNYASI